MDPAVPNLDHKLNRTGRHRLQSLVFEMMEGQPDGDMDTPQLKELYLYFKERMPIICLNINNVKNKNHISH